MDTSSISGAHMKRSVKKNQDLRHSSVHKSGGRAKKTTIKKNRKAATTDIERAQTVLY